MGPPRQIQALLGLFDQLIDLIHPGLLVEEQGVLSIAKQFLQPRMGLSTVARPIKLHSIQRLGLWRR